ncbi:MAG: hypothetical protein Q9220_007459 [cf. Caloplaca sp. 1 TL-2023]
MLRTSCRFYRTSISRSSWSQVPSPCRHPRRCLAVAAAGLPSVPFKSDDNILRDVFDSEHFWRHFNKPIQSTIPSSSSSSSSKGLFGNYYLTHPEGFTAFSRATVEKCERLVAFVVEASTFEERRLIPRNLDRLSDCLCRLLDMANFVRLSHPDPAFRDASTEAHARLFEYMNVFNTTPDLKIKLESALADPHLSASWNEEEKMVAQILLKDFSQSAIDLPDDKRRTFVELSNRTRQLGIKFVEEMRPEISTVSLSNRQLKEADPLVLQHASTRFLTGISIPTVGPVAFTALRSIGDETARRDLYIKGRTAPRSQLQTLQDLLQTRAMVANLNSYKSYAEMNLSDKLAQTPAAVNSFLDALIRDNASLVQQEMDEMLVVKKSKQGDTNALIQIEAWDRDYMQAQLSDMQRSRSRRPDFMSAYFSLGTVMQGLSRLFNQLYGIRFVPTAVSPGETWDHDVRRLDVVDEKLGHIAVLYCDLFSRPGKSPDPAHFTVRCSRRIYPSEIEEASFSHPDLDPLQAVNDGMAISHNPSTNTTWQLPTIALNCDFEAPNPHTTRHPVEPTLLSFRSVQTLFHEMGHAIHSILGRTACHAVSGTRCATDFAELPSVLMEHFAVDPHVLGLFARHWQTDAPLPYDMVAERLAVDRKGQGVETEHQILLALLDQAYHSDLPLTMASDFDSTKVMQDVFDKYGSVREPRETSVQGFFGHLVEYGGTYYSYLLDRAIAGRVWQEVFDAGKGGGAISRDRGQRFHDEVLRWGGSRDGWRCLASLLGDEKLRHGGSEAMAEVGKWGVQD